MKVSLNLIKQFTELKLSESELLERIASRIGEIESVERLGPKYDQLVVGKIESATEHPEADKLGVYQVDIGGQTVQVVAGDKTLQAGDLVCYIPPGATVPATVNDDEPLVIAQRELRGQESNGMLASLHELDLGDDHSGVLVLDGQFKPGQAFVDCYELDDVIIEIENKVLTHRGDCFGHIGFAREVAGIQQVAFTSPDWLNSQAKQDLDIIDSDISLSAINQVPELCKRLTLMGLSQVKNQSAPLLIRTYLQRLGVRSVSAVVDATNYLMLISGQPLHAFDYDKLLKLSSGSGVELHVRAAKTGEKLKLLGGAEVKLQAEDLVIATDSQAVSLAGVMGGAETEVDAKTERVVLEVANFDMYAVRNTSMRHGLFTDAVTRFARGLDPHLCLPVQHQAAQLLSEVASAKVATEVQDVFDQPSLPRGIVVSSDFINARLGSNFKAEQMAEWLNQVEVDTVLNKSNLALTPPTWRPDLAIAEDVVEEIGRLSGYDNLPVTLPQRSVKPTPVTANQRLAQRVADWLRSAGAHEVLSYSGVSGQLLEKATQDHTQSFAIKNALSPQLEFMRQSLVPSLLDKVHPNLRQGYDQFVLFEVGTTHHKQLMTDGLPDEQPVVGLVMAASKKSDAAQRQGAVYFEAAHWLKQLMRSLGVDTFDIRPLSELELELADDPWLQATSCSFAPNRAAVFSVDGQNLAVVGEFKPSVGRAFKLPTRVASFELHRGRLLELDNSAQSAAYRYLSRYPKVENDMTLSLAGESNQPFAAIAQALEQQLAQTDLNYKFKPIDIWQGDENQGRHLTFRIWTWRDDRTLTSQEANATLDEVAAALAEQHGATRI